MSIESVSVLVLLPAIVSVIGVGLVSPGAALGVAPGVMVNTHVLLGAIVPQLVGLIVVPAGNAGDKL